MASGSKVVPEDEGAFGKVCDYEHCMSYGTVYYVQMFFISCQEHD